VSDYNHTEERAELERVNEELTESLARCRFMLAETREKLAANSNDEEGFVGRDRKRSGV
jgi:hypothetical protein